MRSDRYLTLAACVFCGLVALAGLNAWLQAGAPTRNGTYTCSYIDTKVVRGGAIAEPKLVVVSGSNGLTGIDLAMLSRALSIKAFNFGLAASFGPGFQTFEAEKILRPGDVVLMPLEYLAYDYQTPQDSLVDAVYTCGGDYWRTLAFREKLFFVFAAKPQRIFDSLLFRSHPRAVAAASAEAASDVGPLGQGTAKSGLAAATSHFPGHWPLAIRLDAHSPGAHAIVRFVRWAQAHDVTVLATWPTTLYFPQYRDAPGLADIRRFYRSLGVEVVGAPDDAMYPEALMGDTIYHLNRAGMIDHTERLVQLLRRDETFLAWRRQAAGSQSIAALTASPPSGPPHPGR